MGYVLITIIYYEEVMTKNMIIMGPRNIIIIGLQEWNGRKLILYLI